MDLHPLAARFGDVAGAYERGRPGYSQAVVGALAAELELAPGAPAVDLAAGTGKLTRAMLEWGLDVIAVEPQEQMREILAGAVGPERIRAGMAEAIPLGDDSCEAVTVADGFHWFDPGLALAEIGRVLRPGGGLAVLWSVPDLSGAGWAGELGELMDELRPEHPYFDGEPWQVSLREAGGWMEPREVRVITAGSFAPEQVIDYLGSMSWVAAMEDGDRADTVRRIETMVEAGGALGNVDVHVSIGLTGPV